MNTHPVLLKLAKQGDARAIAALMNDALREQEVWVKATRDDRCLQVMLKAPRLLDQPTCITFLRWGMARLQTEAIDHVRAYGWQTYADFPDWVADFSLRSETGQETIAVEDRDLRPVSPITTTEVDSSVAQTSIAKTTSPDASLEAVSRPQPRSDAVKFGVVVVLATMLYFAVTIAS